MTVEYELTVDGVNCRRCERLLERELGGLTVVGGVVADADAGTVLVRAATGTDVAIVETIRASGYPVTDWRRRTG